MLQKINWSIVLFLRVVKLLIHIDMFIEYKAHFRQSIIHDQSLEQNSIIFIIFRAV